MLKDLATYLENRIPGPDVTPEQLRNRSWWKGAEVFVVVDDYDLVATQQSSPVQPLLPLLPQARDTGLHLAVARRSGGASRALYEPVIQSLRDLAMPGLLLSGSPDEGPLIGNQKPMPALVRARPPGHPRPRRRGRAARLDGELPVNGRRRRLRRTPRRWPRLPSCSAGCSDDGTPDADPVADGRGLTERVGQ